MATGEARGPGPVARERNVPLELHRLREGRREREANLANVPDRIRNGFILAPLLETQAAVALPTVVAERALVDDAGRFDEAMRTREDYALWLELAARAEVITTPEQLTIVRDHPGRIFRPEGYRVSVALYRRWLGRLTDRPLRRVCRRRIADSYLTEGRHRWEVGQWRLAVAGMLGAMRWDPPQGVRRLLGALVRRVGIHRD